MSIMFMTYCRNEVLLNNAPMKMRFVNYWERNQLPYIGFDATADSLTAGHFLQLWR